METRGGPAWSDDIRAGSYRRPEDRDDQEAEAERRFLTQGTYPQAQARDPYFPAPGRPSPPPPPAPVKAKRTVPLWATVVVGVLCLAAGAGGADWVKIG